jgi:hypothetical protein
MLIEFCAMEALSVKLWLSRAKQPAHSFRQVSGQHQLWLCPRGRCSRASVQVFVFPDSGCPDELLRS